MYGIDNLDMRVNESLDAVGLSRRADDVIAGYSRGMQQRLTIARAFLHKPTLLLLDEPYTGLDTYASEILNRLLISFKTPGCAGILTTHNIDQGFDIATHVIILHRSRIHYYSPTGEIAKDDFKRKYLEVVQPPEK